MKPTMLQTLLGLPSQSYKFPSEKDYYRSQPTMRQIANDTHVHDKKVTSSREFLTIDTDDDTDDTFYTPDSSPRSSMAIPFPMNSNASSTSLSSTTASVDGQSIFSSESPPTQTTPPTSESGHSKRSSMTYTDEDWAKEVRWLVQPIPRTKPRASPKSFLSSPASLSVPPRLKPPAPRIAHMSKSMSRATPSIMTVLEEDEDLAVTLRPKSRVLINGPPNLQRRRSRSLENMGPQAESSTPSNGTPGYTSLTLPRAPPPPFQPISSRGSHKVTMVGGGDGRIDLTISGVAQTTMLSVEVVQGLGLQAGKGLLAGLGRRRTVSTKSTDDAGLAFTSYRKPPDFIPGSGVLVQVWAVGVDGVDATLVGSGANSKSKTPSKPGLFRSMSQRSKTTTSAKQITSDAGKEPEVGFVPGRSFVGRVLECGWEVRDEFIRKGEWVVGLLDMRKSGALQEFIIVDRHRVHRIPQPVQASEAKPQARRAPGSRQSITRSDLSTKRSSSGPEYSRYPYVSLSPPTPTRRRSVASEPLSPSLSLEDFSLFPLCGVPAYRAVRTLTSAFPSSMYNAEKGKRVLVLRGHEGTGAMAVQMLVRRGWRVSAHVPLPIFVDDEQRTLEMAYMKAVEDKVRAWGADEVIFDDGGEDEDGASRIEDRGDGRSAVVRVITRLLDDGDVFDAVLDTVGGKEVWESSERLLRGIGRTPPRRSQKGVFKPQSLRQNPDHRKGMGLFVTLVGDYPDRPIPSASDLFKTGLRSLKSNHNVQDRESGGNGKVGYVWINSAQDVDWEGEDTRESLGAVVNMALNEGIRPFIGENNRTGYERVVTFDRAPRIFTGHGHLSHGAVTVVKIVS